MRYDPKTESLVELVKDAFVLDDKHRSCVSNSVAREGENDEMEVADTLLISKVTEAVN